MNRNPLVDMVLRYFRRDQLDVRHGETLLGASERAHYGRLASDSRRAEWLAGRIAVKQVCLPLLPGDCAPSDVEILSSGVAGASGAPRLVIRGQSSPLAVSLSHDETSVLVGVRRSTSGRVGVDLAPLGRLRPSFAVFWFDPTELPPERFHDATAVARRWAAKEAAYKSAATTRPFAPRSIRVYPLREAMLGLPQCSTLYPPRDPWLARNPELSSWRDKRWFIAVDQQDDETRIPVLVGTKDEHALAVAFSSRTPRERRLGDIPTVAGGMVCPC